MRAGWEQAKTAFPEAEHTLAPSALKKTLEAYSMYAADPVSTAMSVTGQRSNGEVRTHCRAPPLQPAKHAHIPLSLVVSGQLVSKHRGTLLCAEAGLCRRECGCMSRREKIKNIIRELHVFVGTL